MDFVSLQEFLDDIMPEVPGCTEFTAEDKIRWAAIEFTKKTLVSQDTVEELDLDVGEAILDIPELSQFVLLYKILWVQNPQQFMRVLNRHQMASRNLDWQSAAEMEYPSSFVVLSNTQIHLVPTPSVTQSGAIDVRAAYIPSRNATKLDALLINNYREAIVCGALSSLLSMSNEDWYDPNEATRKGRFFAAEISNARAAVNKDMTTVDNRVQYVSF
jgi:hypothetical protein